MKKIMLVFGTRPEAIKMCPLVLELRKRKNIKTIVCVTGQHREMLDSVLRIFGVKPDYDLDIMKSEQSLFDITTDVLLKLKQVIEREAPDIILVHGDTTTAFSAALSAFYLGIPVGHVEAGLRSGNMHSPFPEEFNRRAVSLVSALNFAPTEAAKNNLLKEGISEKSVFVTGNTIVDAMRYTLSDDHVPSVICGIENKRVILLTAHRRENIPYMYDIFCAVAKVLDNNKDVFVVYPVHPNPKLRHIAEMAFKNTDNILLTAPLSLTELHNLLARCYAVLTDSGGIQEEAVTLGVPAILLRDTTERYEGITEGGIIMAGSDKEKISETFSRLLNDKLMYSKMSAKRSIYGNGYASEAIADILEKQI